ncbi:branched-chain-amino-acid transaminase [Fimbriimonas ginsengisoli]|uniref:Branched-chain-amino-acid aminotransferase n=1 Tax=Fimbriimonas ginsengisoli Gsoil 348 TaxID=661478 RepID=A0A068NYE4_FIMGI|nr:branched-chain-amino-acid transaminase [Fimbriimonas ginsengisoli]AIE88045.1 branched chain amino acid aminotransferase apoenzyme [Fimbriimonas ginsengisoli Gsoil 348]
MPRLVWLNGQVMPLENATTSVADHAHLYGDGLFEGIRIYDRKVFKLDEHLRRLYHGISYLGYEMHIGFDELRATVLDVCRQADIEAGYIRLNVTRGTGLGLDPKNINRTPNVMVMVSTLSLYPEDAYEIGLHVVTCSLKVIPADVLDPRVKCIGRYASNILAKQEANRAGAGEGLMLNQQGHIAECTGDNVFLVNGRHIRTPHPASGILQGITRDTVIMLAREAGYTVEETFLTPYDVFSADEAFLTGTAAEVIAMVSLDSKKIGCGTPGEVTLDLMGRFRAHTATGVPF